MELTRFVPACTKVTAAVAVGAMALTLAGLHAPGVGAASQHPPGCQSFTIADAQGTSTGPVAGEVQTVPSPGAQAGTQAGGVSTQGRAGETGQVEQTGQTEQAGEASSASSALETVSCVAEVGGASGPMCVVTFPDAAGQTGAAGTFSTDAGTTAQNASGATTAQAGGTQQTGPGQLPGVTQAQTGDAGPSANQALGPNSPATATTGEQGTQGAQGAQGTQGSAGAPAAPAGEAGTGAGGATSVQSGQPFVGTGGDDVVVSGTAATCDVVGSVGTGAPLEVIDSGTTNTDATTNTVPASGQAEQAAQAPASGCEETILSETPLPSGGSIKVSMNPC